MHNSIAYNMYPSYPLTQGSSGLEPASSMEVLSHADVSSSGGVAETNKKKRWLGLDLNMQGVFLHVLADCLGSVVVIVSTAIVWQVECLIR